MSRISLQSSASRVGKEGAPDYVGDSELTDDLSSRLLDSRLSIEVQGPSQPVWIIGAHIILVGARCPGVRLQSCDLSPNEIEIGFRP